MDGCEFGGQMGRQMATGDEPATLNFWCLCRYMILCPLSQFCNPGPLTRWGVEDAYDLEQLEASPFAAAIRCRDVKALRYPPDLSPVKTIRTLFFLTIGRLMVML